MEQKILIINTGSASKKYAVYSNGAAIFTMHIEKEDGAFVATTNIGEQSQKALVSQADYDAALAYLLATALTMHVIADKNEIAAAGVRIVAPGNYFLTNSIIDDTYLANLRNARERAPLHLGPAIAEIEQLQRALPGASIAGISDSAFHATLPLQARLYNLPEDMAAKYGVYRFGYHGISAQSVITKAQAMLGTLPSRVIICHLGSGASIHAVKDGRSFDTSMGFTPLEGLTMSTRIGNIDAGAVIYLLQKSGMNPAELETYFNTQCGLLGLSGKTPDMRELLELEKSGDQKAKLAIDAFMYSVRKYIGAYVAVMGGLDLLVFTATIGERSFIIRNRICEGLGGLGITLDQEKNNRMVSVDALINSEHSPVKIAVITTD
ncbi:MAG: acetate/propionate family kinase, partial [bacterium]|nr:acetate/propionate family kinase [bacterium]